MGELPGIIGLYSEEVLGVFVYRDSRAEVTLTFAEPFALAPAASGRDADDALQDAVRQRLLVGDRGEGDGSAAWWSQVRLTAAGLRLLGHWPPAGREAEAGMWDAGYWGTLARPLLAHLHEHPPAHRFLLKPIGEPSDARMRWTAALTLLDAGLISGGVDEDGIDGLRLTAAGQRALDPSSPDPLDRALAKLRNGARVDAIVTAVEGALLGRLKQIATSRGVPITTPDGKPLNAARINTDLRADGAYDEDTRAQVEAWQKARNALAHAQATVSDARIEAIIAGIRVFLDEHPA